MQAKPTEYVVHLEVRVSGPEIEWDRLAENLAADVGEMVVYVHPPRPAVGPFVVESCRVDTADADPE